MIRTSIRARLTLWYGGVLMLTLLGLGVAVCLLMARASLARVDASLDFEFREAAEALAGGRPAAELASGPAAFHEAYLLRVEAGPDQVLAESPRLAGHSLPRAPDGPTGTGAVQHASLELGPLGACRLVSGRVGTPTGPCVLRIATSMSPWQAEQAELRRVLWAILPLGLLAATAGGYGLASSSLAPIGRMTEAARQITAESLDRRLVVGHPGDELGRLATTLNAMLDRIDRGFAAARRFTADAAHELRTPVATIRTEAEVCLLKARTPEEYAETLRSVVEEAGRLGRLADRLLTLSREDAGATGGPRPVRLDRLVGTSVAAARDAAQAAGIALDLEGDALDPMVVMGDAEALRQVFDNLLDNAVQYTTPGGGVRVRGGIDGPWAVVEILDTGVGIAPEVLPRIFDRFFRADPSRCRRTGGAGLGLSIVRAVVERHDGQVEVESRPGVGTRFRVRLPAAPGRLAPAAGHD